MMRAVVLAGGKGTRLKPYTAEIPKPLVNVGEVPIIEMLITCLARHGVDRVTIAVNHLAHLIQSVLGDGSRLGVAIDYSLEDTPLSTVGPLRLIKDLPEDFIVTNGDIITGLNFKELFEFHCQRGTSLTIAVHRRKNPIDYGVIHTDDRGMVTGFEEKPTFDFTVSMGAYVFSRSILERIPRGKPFGFDQLVIGMLNDGHPVATFPFDGFWLDIGRPEDYELANENIDTIRAILSC